MTTDASWLDEMPEHYDRALGPALFAPCSVEVAQRLAALRPERLLEVAAGTGQLTRELVRVLPGAQVLATDLNESMVAWGASRVPEATWRQADAQRLDGVEDASQDVVVCQFGVMFVPDRGTAFREARRVLRPGGALVLVVWEALARSTFPSALAAALADVLPEDTPDFLTRLPYGLSDPDVVQGELEAAGLEVVAIESLRLQGHAVSAAVLAEGFCLGTPLRFALAERGDLAELTRAVEQRLAAQLGEGPLVGDLGAYVVTARRPADGAAPA